MHLKIFFHFLLVTTHLTVIFFYQQLTVNLIYSLIFCLDKKNFISKIRVRIWASTRGPARPFLKKIVLGPPILVMFI